MTAVILDSGGVTGLLRRPERLQILSDDRLGQPTYPQSFSPRSLRAIIAEMSMSTGCSSFARSGT